MLAEDGEVGRGLRALFDKVPLGVIVLTPAGMVRWANGGALALVGRSADEITGRPLVDMLHPDDRAAARARMTDLAATGASPPLRDFRLVHKSGDQRCVEVTGSVMTVGGEAALVSMLRDVTNERRLEERNQRAVQALAAERALLDAILANVEDGVTLLDGEQRCVFANRAHAEAFATTPERLIGLMPDEFFALAAPLLEDPSSLRARIGEQKREPSAADDVFVFAGPTRRVMRRRAGPVLLPSGPGFLIVWRDVTIEHDRLAERERQSTTDPLTGLYNRRGAEAAAARERARAERAGTPLSVVVFDIDHFKRVNDTHGHATGDDVLRSVAHALTTMARVTDVIARWGGEEFVALLPGGIEGARSYAERTRAAVAALDVPPPGPLTLSAGVAELSLGEPFEAALARADAYLYEAKRAGRDRIVG